ncbi:MAG TPA: GWxTD domain-containing protein [Candidatus Acidoferrales bacterium]
MRSHKKRTTRTFLALGLTSALVLSPALLPASAYAQEQQEQKQESDKERKKKDKELYKELANVYKKWLDDEVQYIIMDEERTAFLRLSTNEEREQFIESFWNVRDPTPDTIENEAREEHYHRIAFANERFASGVPGWKTDRGRIYIIWGPPTEIESYPSGGGYQRTWEEGGGSTSVFPFERWRYRYLEGLGNEVILEFVDKTGSNEYRLTMDPSEKDALLLIPGAGLSDLEAMGMASKTDRFNRPFNQPATIGPVSHRMNQFDRLSQYARVMRAPDTVKFRELQELVVSRIVRNQLAFEYRFDFLRVAGDTVLVPITVQIANRQMTFRNTEGVHSATLNLFARITTITGRRVQVFEDVIQRDVPESLLSQSLEGMSVYQKAVPLRPGRYRLDIVIKDVESGNVGVVNTVLPVPRYEETKLSSSTLILADQIERVPARSVGLGQFVLGGSKVRPRLDGAFTTDDSLGVYLQVYNLGIDETTQKPSASVEYIVRANGKDEPVLRVNETSAEIEFAGEQMTLEKVFALSGLPPGKYKLEVLITDNVNKQTIAPTAEFTVKPAPTRTAAVR